MDIRTIIESDARIIAIKQEYNVLIAKKNEAILAISHIEADIIKLQGKYEATAQEIVKPFQPQPNTMNEVVPESVEPVETPVAEDNVDDGFAEPGSVSEAEPTAETARTNGEV